jgi:hypothetical protein
MVTAAVVGTASNLTAADHMLLIDLWWSPPWRPPEDLLALLV